MSNSHIIVSVFACLLIGFGAVWLLGKWLLKYHDHRVKKTEVVPRELYAGQRADAEYREQEKAIRAAKIRIGICLSSLDFYRLDVGGYPTTQQGLRALVEPPENPAKSGWHGPYISSELVPLDAWGNPLDPWGNKYKYEYDPTSDSPHRPDIWSAGPDGDFGTADDIRSK